MLPTINDVYKAGFNSEKRTIIRTSKGSATADDKAGGIMEPDIIEPDIEPDIVEISQEALNLQKSDASAKHEDDETAPADTEEQSPASEITELLQEPEESQQKSKGKIGINAAKLARKLSAAKTRSQVRAVISEIKQDLKECESGKKQGMDVDEASVQAAKSLLGRAQQQLAQADNREATPEEETAFALAGLM